MLTWMTIFTVLSGSSKEMLEMLMVMLIEPGPVLNRQLPHNSVPFKLTKRFQPPGGLFIQFRQSFLLSRQVEQPPHLLLHRRRVVLTGSCEEETVLPPFRINNFHVVQS